jgi:hypothetical protein
MSAEQLLGLLGMPINALEGGVRRGASETVIDSLPTHRVPQLATGTGTGTGTDAGTNAKLSGDADADADGSGKEKKGEGEEGDVDTCNICLCDYEANETVKTLPCGHCYHAPCIDRWLRSVSNCPVCKQDVGRSR